MQILLLTIGLIFINSCHWIKQKIDKKVDKVFPSYDGGQPDSQRNKSRFKEYLQTDLTDDIRNIRCKTDFMGSDYKVEIRFTCNELNCYRIIKAKQFIPNTTNSDEMLNNSMSITNVATSKDLKK